MNLDFSQDFVFDLAQAFDVDGKRRSHTDDVQVVELGHPKRGESRMKVVGEFRYLTAHRAPNAIWLVADGHAGCQIEVRSRRRGISGGSLCRLSGLTGGDTTGTMGET